MASMRRTRSSRSQTLRRVLLGAAALSLVAVTDASAQFAYGYMRAYPGPAYEEDLPPMPPRAVVYRLQDRGFTEIGRPRFDGQAYVVDATNPAGNRIRLFVDAREGGVIGRQRLDTPYYPSAPSGRVARSAPGYGWTEEDLASRRAGRDPEALLPPGEIPLPRPSLHAEIDRAPAVSSRPGAPDAHTFGVNPDGKPGLKNDKARAATAPRKTAKLTPPVKPAAPRVAPEAPLPQTSPAEQAAPSATAAPDAAKIPDAKIPDTKIPDTKIPDTKAPEPATAAIEPPKADPAPLTPAANQPAAAETPAEVPAAPKAAETPPTEAPAEKASTEKPAEDKHADKAPAAKNAANQGWQDPPASDQKRNVRVIGGAIVVPGGGAEAAPAAAN